MALCGEVTKMRDLRDLLCTWIFPVWLLSSPTDFARDELPDVFDKTVASDDARLAAQVFVVARIVYDFRQVSFEGSRCANVADLVLLAVPDDKRIGSGRASEGCRVRIDGFEWWCWGWLGLTLCHVENGVKLVGEFVGAGG
jgi:hypothetical protein